MWSGPRNISTALMRAWDSRGDTFVCDEPFYAHYLKQTGLDHPGREAIMASQPQDWREVADWLTGPIPEQKPIFYQKHMAHHVLPGMEGEWLDAFRHAFLLRDPREMITSLMKVIPNPRVEDTGLPQQRALFERVRSQTGTIPPVLDARDVLEDPPVLLKKLCRQLEVPFRRAMLSWPPGPRSTDGVWASIWYDAVERSTGFQPYRPKGDEVPEHLREVYEECLDHYHALYEYRLSVSGQ